jgi:hypothetical protein
MWHSIINIYVCDHALAGITIATMAFDKSGVLILWLHDIGGSTITWYISCHQTYIEILLRHLSPLTISQAMVRLVLVCV